MFERMMFSILQGLNQKATKIMFWQSSIEMALVDEKCNKVSKFLSKTHVTLSLEDSDNRSFSSSDEDFPNLNRNFTPIRTKPASQLVSSPKASQPSPRVLQSVTFAEAASGSGFGAGSSRSSIRSPQTHSPFHQIDLSSSSDLDDPSAMALN